VSGIKDVAAKLQAKSGEHGIDYLVQTQGASFSSPLSNLTDSAVS
jgi:hypothetical protein